MVKGLKSISRKKLEKLVNFKSAGPREMHSGIPRKLSEVMSYALVLIVSKHQETGWDYGGLKLNIYFSKVEKD